MWKDIKGWEGLYEVSDEGYVRNKLNGHILTGDRNNCGYRRVCLYNKEHTPSKQRFFIHRLVATHFIDNPNCLREVNHMDLNKDNNSVSNLEWITREENERHSRINGVKAYKPIATTTINGECERFDTAHECGRKFGVSSRTILNWLQGISATYWKYGIDSIGYTA